MQEFLQKLRSKVKVALVGGSDLVKIAEQMGGDDGGYNYNYKTFMGTIKILEIGTPVVIS